jgi:TonB family protein
VIPADVGSQIPGTVVIGVKVTIDESGRVVDAQPLDDNGAAAGLLLQPALDAARRWRYLAAVADGRPVRSTSTIRFTFRPRR